MARPSFAIATPNFHPRTCGIGDHSLRLGQELRRRGYAAEIYARAPAMPHPESPEVPIHALEGRFPLEIAEQTRRAVVRDGHSHLIIQYTHHMWGGWRFGSPAAVWLAAAARAAGLQVTVIAHELFTEIVSRPDLLIGALVQRAQIIGMARASDLLFVTTGTRVNALLPFWRAALRGGRPGIVRVGPNALPSPSVRVPGRRRLGVFSTLATNKRFDVVLGAFERVWRRFPGSELVIIGDIGSRSDGRVAEIHEAIARHPGQANIRVTGKLSLQEIADEVANLDVYLFPMTTGANTRSGTLPVALGSGLPVVATRDRETDLDLFIDGDNISFADAMTAEAFGDRACQILEDPALARRLSEGARRLYEQHLSWAHIADTLLQAWGLPA